MVASHHVSARKDIGVSLANLWAMSMFILGSKQRGNPMVA